MLTKKANTILREVTNSTNWMLMTSKISRWITRIWVSAKARHKERTQDWHQVFRNRNISRRAIRYRILNFLITWLHKMEDWMHLKSKTSSTLMTPMTSPSSATMMKKKTCMNRPSKWMLKEMQKIIQERNNRNTKWTRWTCHLLNLLTNWKVRMKWQFLPATLSWRICFWLAILESCLTYSAYNTTMRALWCNQVCKLRIHQDYLIKIWMFKIIY